MCADSDSVSLYTTLLIKGTVLVCCRDLVANCVSLSNSRFTSIDSPVLVAAHTLDHNRSTPLQLVVELFWWEARQYAGTEISWRKIILRLTKLNFVDCGIGDLLTGRRELTKIGQRGIQAQALLCWNSFVKELVLHCKNVVTK